MCIRIMGRETKNEYDSGNAWNVVHGSQGINSPDIGNVYDIPSVIHDC